MRGSFAVPVGARHIRTGVVTLILASTVAGAAFAAAPGVKAGATDKPGASPGSNTAQAEPDGWLPPARDLRGGHWAIGGSASWALPLGDLDQNHGEPSYLNSGISAGLDLGYGLGRSAVLGLWGQYLWLPSPAACTGCGTQSTASGVFLRYHLVQGTRFDPWLSLGVGVRTQRLKDPQLAFNYFGVEWLKVQFGGDWFASRSLAFGPVLEASAGTFTRLPPDQSASVYFHVLAGLRLTLDLPGK